MRRSAFVVGDVIRDGVANGNGTLALLVLAAFAGGGAAGVVDAIAGGGWTVTAAARKLG